MELTWVGFGSSEGITGFTTPKAWLAEPTQRSMSLRALPSVSSVPPW